MVSRMVYGAHPLQEVQRLQSEMNRLFQAATSTAVNGFPAVSVYASQDGIVITAELPGVAVEDLDVSVQLDTVTLRGGRRDQVEAARGFHRRERRQGRFARSFGLPFQVDPDHVEAEMRDGVLRLTLPRSAQDKPKRISVRSS